MSVHSPIKSQPFNLLPLALGCWLLAGCAPSRRDSGDDVHAGSGHAVASSAPHATSYVHVEIDSKDHILVEFDCDTAYDFSAWDGTDRAKDTTVGQLVAGAIMDVAPTLDAEALYDGVDEALLQRARQRAEDGSSVTQKVKLLGIACNTDSESE